MDLDETDVRILKALQGNGRLSYRSIAEKVGVSVPTVSSKIAMMEGAGVLRGYTALIPAEKLGEVSVVVSVKTRPSDLRTVAERVQQDDRVRQTYLTSNGRILLLCTFGEAYQVNEFVNRLSEHREIMEHEVSNVIGVLREEPRALVTDGISAVLHCVYCRKEIRGEPVKTKLEGKDYYLCCRVCEKAFKAKFEKLREKA